MKKGERSPGEPTARFGEPGFGELYANTASGVFGRLEDAYADRRPGAGARGGAQGGQDRGGHDSSNIAGDQVEEYQVEIIRCIPPTARIPGTRCSR